MGIKEDILNKIKQGEISARPKSYFIWQAAFLIFGVVVLFVFAVFFVSFVFNNFGVNNATALFSFGGLGFKYFIRAFPWIPVILALVLVFFLGFALEKYSFVYRKPFLYLLMFFIIIFSVSTFFEHTIAFHEWFSRFSQERGVPFAQTFYRDFDDIKTQQLIIEGSVANITGEEWQIQNANGEALRIHVLPEVSAFAPNITIGDNVKIIGEKEEISNEIEAFAVKIIVK